MNTLVGARASRLADTRPDVGRDSIDRIADRDLGTVLATHRPSHDATSCRTCGFAYSEKYPLCPDVADALRTLAAGDARHTTPSAGLGPFSTKRLRAMAREHCGQGRCRRCGFVYAGKLRSCPTARRIAHELESRGKAPVTQPSPSQGLCAGKAGGWTVHGNAPAPWKSAMAACRICPLLAQCDTDLNARLATGDKISEQVIAGRLFTVTGREIAVDEIEAFAVARGHSKKRKPRPRPTQRAATAPTAPTPTPTPPQSVQSSTTGKQLALFTSAVA